MTRPQLAIFTVVLGALAGLTATVDALLGMAVFVFGLLVFAVIVIVRARRGALVNNRGLTLMGEGRLVEALAMFERAAPLLSRSPLPRFNQGLANLWLWRLDASRDALERSTTAFNGRALRVVGAPALTLIAALQNDATRYEVLLKEVTALDVARGSVVWVAKAVMAARAKQWREVLDALTLEHTRPLGGPARAVADALRAWASAELGGQRLPVDAIGVFGETGPSAVKPWWPEFADFLERSSR